MTGATLPLRVRLGSLTGPLVDMVGPHSSLPTVLPLKAAPIGNLLHVRVGNEEVDGIMLGDRSPAKESLVAAQEH